MVGPFSITITQSALMSALPPAPESNPACRKILRAVPGSRSVDGFPAMVTMPGFSGYTYCRCDPRIRRSCQPSASTCLIASLTCTGPMLAASHLGGPCPRPDVAAAGTRGAGKKRSRTFRWNEPRGRAGRVPVSCSRARPRPGTRSAPTYRRRTVAKYPQGRARSGDAVPVPLRLRVRPGGGEPGVGALRGRVGWPAMWMVPAARQLGQVIPAAPPRRVR